MQRLERMVVMHGTSRYREESARLLAEIVSKTHAQGAAYGWTDALAPNVLVPVHAVGCSPGVLWDTELPRTVAPLLDRSGSFFWRLVIRGADEDALARSAPLVSRALKWFADARDHDCTFMHPDVSQGSCARFVALLDAYRFTGFQIGMPGQAESLQAELRAELDGLPERARGAGHETVRYLVDRGRLGETLLELGGQLDLAGALPEAVSVLRIAYELTLHEDDVTGAIDVARAAGRGFRKLADWPDAFQWYRLAQRIAALICDDVRLAIALDGEGNAHRECGAFPAARKCYERGWRVAVASGDGVAIGSTGHSMMVIERAAGRLEEAARYGWNAVRSQPDRELRARLLVELGTLLIEFGDVSVARYAYQTGAAMTDDVEIAALATDAIAYTDALLGDWVSYAENRRRAGAVSRTATPRCRIQMGYYRARCLLLQGRPADASRILAATERSARAIGSARWAVQAGELRDSLERRRPLPRPRSSEAPTEVRQGLVRLAAEVAA